ncbi:MAG: sigma-54-dependent Fis family transcriptional regulator [Deltaproteobacteria bacterium]|nr:sigma-54-dependent Fis family transcriptional regulator [Deltaproteobacteria bacterium]
MQSPAALPLPIPGSTTNGIATVARTLSPLLGGSRAHDQLLQRLDLLAHDGRPLLIVGQPGVGKTLVARHLHWRSAAAAAPCARIDLRRLPYEMIESELFGHVQSRLFNRSSMIPGIVDKVGEGLCILEGLDAIPAAVQARLLPWFANQAAAPVGSTAAEHLPARIIVELRASRSPRLKVSPMIAPIHEILQGSTLELQPLADRRDDILPIAEHYLTHYADAWGLGPRHLGPDAARALRRGQWRANVRGLIAAVAHATLVSADAVVTAQQLPAWATRLDDANEDGLANVALEAVVEEKLATFFERLGNYDVRDLYTTVLEKVERPLLRLVMKRTGGNQVRAARILGINRNTLRARLRALGR